MSIMDMYASVAPMTAEEMAVAVTERDAATAFNEAAEAAYYAREDAWRERRRAEGWTPAQIREAWYDLTEEEMVK